MATSERSFERNYLSLTFQDRRILVRRPPWDHSCKRKERGCSFRLVRGAGFESEDLDGSLWIAQSYFSGNSGPLCRITDLSVHCFGETEGMPLQLGRAILADGKGGVWIGSDM